MRVTRELGDVATKRTSICSAMLAERRNSDNGPSCPVCIYIAAAKASVEVLSRRRSSVAHLIGGAVEAQAGRVEAARVHQAALQRPGAESDAIQVSWQEALAGEMALSLGDLARAESGFQAAQFQIGSSFSIETTLVSLGNNLPFRDGLARVKAARGQLAEAITIYRRLNEPDITSTWISMLEPRFVLAVARLAARAGDTATASAEYRRFLQLWKNADEGLPELAEARAHDRNTPVIGGTNNGSHE